VALLVDLAEFLFQFGDQGQDALFGLLIRGCPHRQLAILHDLHFEFDAFVSGRHWRTPSK
jgi:hypothetical protein